jgi:hypothetical protein
LIYSQFISYADKTFAERFEGVQQNVKWTNAELHMIDMELNAGLLDAHTHLSR